MYIRRRLGGGASALFALALMAACGSVGSDDPDASETPPADAAVDSTTPDDDGGADAMADAMVPIGDYTVSVSPGSLDIQFNKSASTTVSIARVGVAAAVDLSVEDLPDNVTASFDVDPVPADATTSKLTLTVKPGAVVGTTTIKVVGKAGGKTKEATLDLTVQAITVSGTISTGAANVTVVMPGKGSTTTDGSGKFTFTNVAPPYDLYTVGSSAFAGSKVINYYIGLSRPDPVVTHSSGGLIIFPFTSSGSIAGTVTGGAAFNASHKGVVIWDSTSGKDEAIPSGGAYSFTASWPTAASKSGKAHAFQWGLRANGAPDTFTGYGFAATTLTADGTSTGVNINMNQAVSSKTLTGTISAPTGFPTPTLTLTARFLNTLTQTLWTASTTTVDAGIPTFGGSVSGIHAVSTAGNGATTQFQFPGLTTDKDVSFSLPAPPSLAAPADAATGVGPGTTFTFTAVSDAVQRVLLSTTSGTNTTYIIITTAGTFKLPSIPEAPLPAGIGVNWTATAFGPYASVDEAATSAGITFVSAGVTTGTLHFQAQSASRSFTSAP
jgi:hypothetical protein